MTAAARMESGAPRWAAPSAEAQQPGSSQTQPTPGLGQAGALGICPGGAEPMQLRTQSSSAHKSSASRQPPLVTAQTSSQGPSGAQATLRSWQALFPAQSTSQRWPSGQFTVMALAQWQASVPWQATAQSHPGGQVMALPNFELQSLAPSSQVMTQVPPSQLSQSPGQGPVGPCEG